TTLWVLPPWATVILAAVAAALAAGEVASIIRRLGAPVPPLFVSATAAIVTVACVADLERTPADALIVVLLALVVAGGAVTLAQGQPGPSTLAAATALIMAPLYVGLPLGVVAWVQCVNGAGVTTWLLAMIAVSDSAQYYCGRTFGRHKLAPEV